MIKGVLFDFDGTIVDSEPSRFNSLNKVLEDFNYQIQPSEWNLNYKKYSSMKILNIIKEKYNLNFDVKQLYDKSHQIREKEIAEKGLPLIKGFKEFYSYLQKEILMSCLICSGGKKDHLENVFSHIKNLPKIPFISREDYDRAKPFPDCYLMGLKKLELKPDEVLVFDDTYSGLKAGLDAGCKVIAVNCEDTKDLAVECEIKDYTQLELFELFQDEDLINTNK